MTRSQLLLLALGAAAVFLSTFEPTLSADPVARGMARLSSAFRGTRPVAGRLTVTLGYASPDSASPAGPKASERRRAVRDLQRIVKERTSRGQHALGLLDLLAGRPGRAVRRLETAELLDQTSAPIKADLAAAYLERATAQNAPADLGRALAAAHRAVELDPALSAARFQRALALERLHLDGEARAAWRDCVRNSEPGWTQEAAAHLRELLRPTPAREWRSDAERILDFAAEPPAADGADLVLRDPQAARLLIEEELLPAWAEAEERGQLGIADVLLAKARLLAQGLSDFNSDRLAADEVTSLDHLRANRRASRLADVLAGHRALGKGRRLYSQAQFALARPQFAEAARALQAAGSPFAGWARFYLAACDHFAGRDDLAARQLTELWHEVLTHRHRSLAGRIRWSRGLIAHLQVQSVRAEAEYRAARDIFSQLGERENTAKLDDLLAEVLPDLGRLDDAWRHLHAALRSRGWLHNRQRLDGFLYNLADAFLREELPDAALYAQSELARVAAQRGDAYASCEALLARARIEALSGRQQSESTLDQLQRLSANIADPELSRQMRALACEVEATTRLADDPSAARELVSRTIVQDTRAGNVVRLPALYRLRAAAAIRLGEVAAAQADLMTALKLLKAPEASSSSEGPEGLAETVVSVYDDLAGLRAVFMHDPRGAWAAAERGRSWALDELLGKRKMHSSAAGDGTTLEDVQRMLPPGAQALYFALLPDRLLVWLIEPQRFEMAETVVDSKALTTAITRVRKAVAKGEANWRSSADDLSRSILGRLVKELRPGSRLLIFPDKQLHAVPFPILHDSKGRLLIEEHDVSVFPNATMLAIGGVRRQPSAISRVLVVGPPRLDPEAFPDLRDLPGAAEEARAIVALYPRARFVTSEGATEDAVRRGVTGSEIVQISAHAIVSQRLPWRSLLPLRMTGESSDGGLYAQEVAALELNGTSLVVLAACDSGRGSVTAGQGPTSLASAFLAAGSSAVMAALVRVPDVSNGRVVIDFHHRLLAGDSPAAALRHAQLRAWRSGAHPASWASYELLGHGFEPITASR